MNPTLSSLSEAIQLAIAPVFLLTAVAALIGALTQRLARVVDRSRVLQGLIAQETEFDRFPSNETTNTFLNGHLRELHYVGLRGRLINISMVFLVLCAILIGLTVLEMFYAETLSSQSSWAQYVRISFVGGIASFILALILLLAEVLVASYSIPWRGHGIAKKP